MQLVTFAAALLLVFCAAASDAATLEKLQFAGCDQSSTRQRSSDSGDKQLLRCDLAIDSKIRRDALASPSCTMTKVESHAEWFGYFAQSVSLHSIVLWSRKRPAAGHQSTDVWVDAFDGRRWRRCGSVLDRYKFRSVRCLVPRVRILRIRRMRKGALALCEVEAFGVNTPMLGGSFGTRRCQPGYRKRRSSKRRKRNMRRDSSDDDEEKSGSRKRRSSSRRRRRPSCIRCPAGSFSNRWGATSCSKCPPGSFAAGKGHSSCSRCPPGTEASGSGSRRCRRCPAGRFARNSGTARCRRCPAGTHSSSSGATGCSRCPKGKFSKTGAAKCSSCPAPVPHKYSPACYKKAKFSNCFQNCGANWHTIYNYMTCDFVMDGFYGRTASAAYHPRCMHSYYSRSNNYWEAYFPTPVELTHIALWSYPTTAYSYHVYVQVYDGSRWHTCATISSSYTVRVVSCRVSRARTVRIKRYTKNYLALCEVEAYTFGHGRG